MGLVFDTAGVLDSEFRGHGFVLGWSAGDPNGNSVAGPFNDPSQDLLDLDLTRLGNTNYQARVTRIVGGFSRPIDAEIIGNHIYVVEYGGTNGIWEVTLPLAPLTFVTSKVLGSVRNDFSGWVGMKITVGATPLTVSQLGRIFVSGNSGTHIVKLVRASTQTDVPNGSVSITMSGGSAGQFKYGTLASAVTLSANTAYYLVSQETAGGDQWGNFNTTVTTTADGTCDGAVYFGSGYPWSVIGGANHTYVPVDIK
jgi:hypothetical protein